MENTNHSGGNGQIDTEAISEALKDETTVGYKPSIPLETLWGTSDVPTITLRRDLEFMQMHPIVQTALDYYKSGIAGAEFWGGPDYVNPENVEGKPICRDPEIAQFIITLCEQFWQRAIPLIQDGGYPYGWSPGEHIYKEVNGKLVWSHLKVFHPNDGTILHVKYQPMGVRIKNVREKPPVDLWFASDCIPAKACWYAHRPRFGQLYGRSQLLAAWRPWRRLGWRDAVEQVIDAAVYRAGYKGPIVRHPAEDAQTAQTGVPSTKVDIAGNPRRAAREVARQMIEWAKAGAGFTLPSTKYPQAQGGGDKWAVDWPDHVMDVRPLIEAARYLEDQIMLGIGVPPELVRSGGTGSGYSGRSIPREAFLDGQQRIANALLQMFVEQVLRPLVMWNYGPEPFSVQCKSLLKSQADDKMGEDGQGGQGGPFNFNRSQAAKDAWQLRKQHGEGVIGQGTSIKSQGGLGGSPMSVEDEADSKAVEIVRRILKRIAA